MTPLERAIAICGTQSELARRVIGKPATGHVYHWLKNGFSETVAVAIEAAVKAVICESAEAGERARSLGGAVTVEELMPDRDWERDADGAVVSYTVRVRLEDHSVHRPAPIAVGPNGTATETNGNPLRSMSEAA